MISMSMIATLFPCLLIAVAYLATDQIVKDRATLQRERLHAFVRRERAEARRYQKMLKNAEKFGTSLFN